mmetsp:Transcript_27324/g.81968  ORF Transcript_27324/g.81968 Transcript_27324/m.81968 type:complete len:331 (+) Transcript_27324:179-1171(+)
MLPRVLVALVAVASARKAPKKFATAKELELNAPATKGGGDQLYCVEPPDKPFITLLFSSITFDISMGKGRARAASDDDFHEMGRAVVGRLVGADPEATSAKALDEKLAKRPLFPMPWESCPNPFTDCVLDLSPFGNACVRVTSKEPYEVQAVLARGFPARYVMVLGGALLLAAAHPMSANVLFQYASAVTAFQTAALLLLALFAIRRAGGGLKSKLAAAALYSLVVAKKGGTVVKKALTDHWEMSLIYLILVTVFACTVTSMARKTAATRDTVRVASKWTLRLFAVALLHNAFKAPAMQFAVYGMLFLMYLYTRVLKLTHKKEYYSEKKS